MRFSTNTPILPPTMMNSRETYLDHAATSPLRPEATAAWQACVGEADFNPASAHGFGRRAQDALELSRREIASLLEAEPADLVFTGGGTVSDNLAVLGFARAHMDRNPLVVVSAVEHKAVLAAADRARREGAEVAVLRVDTNGVVDPAELETTLAGDSGRPVIVSVMWANNEVGAVQPVAELCGIARDRGAVFHTDAVQAFGKLPVSMRDVPADLLTLTAHKIGGPVGIGALVVRNGLELEPLVYGGSQERSLWPGTQNPCAAAAFAAAARAAAVELAPTTARWTAMRDALESVLRSGIEGLIVHAGSSPARLPQLLSVGIPGADPATLLMSLDLAGIAVSSGSACSSGVQTGSHVLAAMGIDPEAEYAVLRFSFGPYTTEDEVLGAARTAVGAAARARSVLAG